MGDSNEEIVTNVAQQFLKKVCGSSTINLCFPKTLESNVNVFLEDFLIT